MILAQPFDQAYKSRIDLENVRTYSSIFLVKFKGCLLNRVGENTTGMMLPFPVAVIQNQHRFLRCRFCLIRAECCISTFLGLFFIWCVFKIKNWHDFYSFFLLYSLFSNCIFLHIL